MLEDDKRLFLTDEDGIEHEMEIVLTFDRSETRHFVLFTDPEDESGTVYAYSYEADGTMEEVTDPEEIEMCEEVLGAFQKEEEEDGEA
ncbi:MAG: DUF1292 domain-containing protein [Bulleidia sp.]